MTDADSLHQMLTLEEVGPGYFRAQNLPDAPAVVFGGQILAQIATLAARSAEGKDLKSLHTVFARGASPTEPLELRVRALQAGRTFTSLAISVSQGDRLCTESIALLHDPEPDLIRHDALMPAVASPAETRLRVTQHPWWQLAVVDDVDMQDPEALGPPEVNVWTRFIDVPDEPAADEAVLAFASDGFLIATAMRPHPGFGQALAHVTISTSVVSQTLTFHERFDAKEWLLLAHSSPYAGRGRSYGRADVFTENGRLVASYTQDNMIRDIPPDRRPAPGTRSKY